MKLQSSTFSHASTRTLQTSESILPRELAEKIQEAVRRELQKQKAAGVGTGKSYHYTVTAESAAPWKAPEHVLVDKTKVSSNVMLKMCADLLLVAGVIAEFPPDVPDNAPAVVSVGFLRSTKVLLGLSAKQMEIMLGVLEDRDLAQ